MKKSTLLVSFSLTIFFATAQNITAKKDNVNELNSNQQTVESGSIPGFRTSEDAEKIIQSIMDAIGLEPNFKIKKGKVPNVEADIRHHQRYIFYNEEFVRLVNKMAKDKWAAIFILAHEVGHHLNGHTVRGMNSRPEIELEADQFAGFVLCKMGASLEQAQLAMYILANQFASKTHPARIDRLESIEKGWNRADEQINIVRHIKNNNQQAEKGVNQ